MRKITIASKNRFRISLKLLPPAKVVNMHDSKIRQRRRGEDKGSQQEEDSGFDFR
jgi:hypothetical protein